MERKPGKIADLIEVVRAAVRSGDYFDTYHSLIRKRGRNITRPEIEYVLKNGWHEKSKDKYEERYGAWNYAIRGKTIDWRELRVIVSFDNKGMLIITAIDLDLEQ